MLIQHYQCTVSVYITHVNRQRIRDVKAQFFPADYPIIFAKFRFYLQTFRPQPYLDFIGRCRKIGSQ